MKRIFIFLFFAIFFSSLLATLAIAQVGVPPQSEGCYCRAPCQSMIPPELMDCRILTAPQPTHPYYCPGLCKTTTTTTTTEQIVCPQDVKRCPDGSYVGRVPPTCEFAPCPTSCSQVGGQCFPIGFPDQCPFGYTLIKNASCGPSFQMVCCKRTTTETTTTTTTTTTKGPKSPIVCPQPFGKPTILPPGQECPPIEWILPTRIALFGFAILQDFSDFKTVELGVSFPFVAPPPSVTPPATGWLWVDNVKYPLKNIVLDKPMKKLTADVYNNTDLIGTISLTFSQKAYPIPEQPRVVNYRDVAFGEMLFDNVDYKVYLIGRLFTIPVPLAAVPLR
jgi:hypothetical protein